MIDVSFDKFLSASWNDSARFEDLDVGVTFLEGSGDDLWIKVSDFEAYNVSSCKMCPYSQIAENPRVIPVNVRAEVI